MNLSESYKQRLADLAGLQSKKPLNEWEWVSNEIPHDKTIDSLNGAIQEYYIEHRQNFNHVSKEEYYSLLYNDRLDRMKTDELKKYYIPTRTYKGLSYNTEEELNKNFKHRIADEITTWLTKDGKTLGQVWRIGQKYGIHTHSDDFVETFWINADIVPI